MPKLKLHVAPVLLGGGVRLFDGSVPDAPRALERTRVIDRRPGSTHVTPRSELTAIREIPLRAAS